MVAQLVDADGKLKSFQKWKSDTAIIASHQTERHLRTEYDTAVTRAHYAADWRQFEREKDVLPNVKWNPSTSVTPGQDHIIYWNTIWSIDDPFIQEHHPGDRWGCKCSFSSTDEEVTDNRHLKEEGGEDPAGGLAGNPGSSGEIFSSDHPYISDAYPGAKNAVDRFLEENVIMPEAMLFEEIKRFKEGGRVLLHPDVNRKLSDYKAMRRVAEEFAKAGQEVKITPTLHFKSIAYMEIYGALEGTKYWRKCPDLKIGDHFYEFESFQRPFKKEKIFAMLSHGLKQSDRIIIDNTKGASDRLIEKSIRGRLKNKMKITEVWVYEKGKVRRIYPKKAEPS